MPIRATSSAHPPRSLPSLQRCQRLLLTGGCFQAVVYYCTTGFPGKHPDAFPERLPTTGRGQAPTPTALAPGPIPIIRACPPLREGSDRRFALCSDIVKGDCAPPGMYRGAFEAADPPSFWTEVGISSSYALFLLFRLTSLPGRRLSSLFPFLPRRAIGKFEGPHPAGPHRMESDHPHRPLRSADPTGDPPEHPVCVRHNRQKPLAGRLKAQPPPNSSVSPSRHP